MRILLIKPHHREVYKDFKDVATEYPPLGLAYIAAVLEQNGYKEIRIIDMPVEGITEERLKAILTEMKPDIIGVTATTPTITYSRKVSQLCKETLPDSILVMGGPHSTAVPEDVLTDKNVDIVVRGEGEYTMLELVQTVEKKGSLKNVLGISYKEKGKIINNPQRPLIENLDELPFPARHLLPIDKYYYVDVRKKPMTTIFTSRGCPGLCIYCSARQTFGKAFRTRSPKNIVDEIELLVKTYGIRELHILDDTFTLHRQRAMDICDEIIRRKLDIIWCCPNGVRVNTVDDELLRKMKQSGCYSLAFGFESGSQKVLNAVMKGITLDQSRNAIKLAKKAGIETWGFFMMGLPEDTEETIRQTIDFAKELDPDIAKFHITVPFPGTELYQKWEREGIIKSSDWDRYGIHASDIVSFPGIPAERLKELHKTAYREFYMRPRYMLRYLKRLTPDRFLNSIKGGFVIIKYAISGD
jgi:anaerobic magnesium-protoporphyrin IX monomethyl ester cyclase